MEEFRFRHHAGSMTIQLPTRREGEEAAIVLRVELYLHLGIWQRAQGTMCLLCSFSRSSDSLATYCPKFYCLSKITH
jgi:hypothetical protein